MTRDQIRKLFFSINIWKKGDQRAPHKPLLLLLALGKVQQGTQWIAYSEVKDKLGQLLLEFGPPRPTRTIDPFLRLPNDGIWKLSIDNPRFRDSFLLDQGVTGGFTDEIYSALARDPGLVKELAEGLLIKHFPESVHEDILAAVGLDLGFRPGISQEFDLARQRTRDPNFRNRVLLAYEYSCAICGFNVRLGSASIALDAAHIKWHQFGGPDIESNGLALCSLHHKLFDRGAFALRYSQGDYVVKVAQQAHGTSGFEEWLLRFHDRAIRRPQSPHYCPDREFAQWHWREVFKEPSRYSPA
ncbi:MAG: HNH endonuclease [Bacillota bacterium]|nr:HNH endonuclease [Bacillota bacterium]NLJ01899.1 restriction endonuclease [Bacillota bacterium]